LELCEKIPVFAFTELYHFIEGLIFMCVFCIPMCL